MGYKDESISFRFLALSSTELDELRQSRPDVISRSARGREGRLTGVFDLRAGEDYQWLKGFINCHNISPETYGLFMSVATSSDSEIISVPRFAVDLVREIGGVIDFSFTVLSDEEE
jgi:hypothetical protein